MKKITYEQTAELIKRRARKGLSELGLLAGRRHGEETYRCLERKLAEGQNEARCLHLGADMEFRRGRYAKALEVSQAARRVAGGSPVDWLPSALLEVRALLREVRVEEAAAAAESCHQTAVAKWKQYEEACRRAPVEFSEKGEVTIPPKPNRVCVVASKLGLIFLTEGELSLAQGFYGRAITGNPKGGCRARQGLAIIALRQGDYPQALQRASEAITLGKFQAKTLGAWPLLLDALQGLGRSEIGPELLAALRCAQPPVRARAVAGICALMRLKGWNQWEQVAQQWIEREGREFPKEAIQLKLLWLADLKHANDNPGQQARLSWEILGEPKIQEAEWLMAAKECVRASCFLPEQVEALPQKLIARALYRFGREFAAQATHSLALSLMLGKRHDLARGLLRELLQRGVGDTVLRRKALWAWARMEAVVKEHAASARLYREFADLPDVPIRFRLKSEVEWAKQLAKSGDTEQFQEAAPRLEAVVSQMTDYEEVLNIARQIQFAPKPMSELAVKFYQQGRDLALAAYQAAAVPEEAAKILFHLARRQVYDFGRSEQTVDFWESIPQEKKLWMWSSASPFWEYLGFVVEAYCRTDRLKVAEQLAGEYLNDPATPALGIVQVAVPLGEALIDNKRTAEGLDLFRLAVSKDPVNYRCAIAWYWLAINEKRMNKESVKLAEKINQCIKQKSTNLHDIIIYYKSKILSEALQYLPSDHEIVNGLKIKNLEARIQADVKKLS